MFVFKIYYVKKKFLYILMSKCLNFQRCVVVQEVYPDGLIAIDGRLQPGDQIIEINGVDMTCAPHSQVTCTINNTHCYVNQIG